MPTEEIARITAYIAIAVPATVAIANLAKLGLQWLQQRHSILTAEIQQNHQITTQYLDRALDPTVPLAIRHQLLRFLATPDKSGSRLSAWAESELKRVGGIVEETNMAVSKAENELHAAKSSAELRAAEKKLQEAVTRQQSLMAPPVSPPITAAALRAGVVKTTELSGLNMQGADLSGASLSFKVLRGANFSKSNLTKARFLGADLRSATFFGANLDRTLFAEADLRGADFSGATVIDVDFEKSRLEGADLSCVSLEGMKIPAVYDSATKWPEGFDPIAAGAVSVDHAQESEGPTNREVSG